MDADFISMLLIKRALQNAFDKWPIIGIAFGILATLLWTTLLIWLPLHYFHVF